jgi:hypothetical protein
MGRSLDGMHQCGYRAVESTWNEEDGGLDMAVHGTGVMPNGHVGGIEVL